LVADVHSVLSFTRLEIPEIEIFETAVTFAPDTDPLTAHDALAAVFGHKAGVGHFLFRADSTVAGRFWVQSLEPWRHWPPTALSALEPKRVVIQLAPGLMYRFTLPVCAGREWVEGSHKRVAPYKSREEVELWFSEGAESFGVRPLLFNVAMHTLRFRNGKTPYKIEHAVIEGALEVADPDRLKRRIVKGFGAYRRAGLGQLQLSSA